MFKKFRMLALAMVLAIGGIGVAQAAAESASVKETTKEIAPGVYSFNPGQHYSSMFVVTDAGVAVFETVNSKHASAMLKEIRKVTDKPIEKGTPPSDIPKTVRLPKYAHWDRYDDWLELNAQRLLLDIWMGSYPWIKE